MQDKIYGLRGGRMKVEEEISEDIKKDVYGVFYPDKSTVYENVSTLKVWLEKTGIVIVHDKLSGKTSILFRRVIKKEEKR